jgi:hypothetical protein
MELTHLNEKHAKSFRRKLDARASKSLATRKTGKSKAPTSFTISSDWW